MGAKGAVSVGVLALISVGVGTPAAASDTITVMTRNVASGADWRPIFNTPDMRSLVAASTRVYGQAVRTRFERRAKGIAQEIQQHTPDLIGLQEVALWRSGPVNTDPSVVLHPTADRTVSDYLQILLKEVNTGPVQYRVAGIQRNWDFETPINSDGRRATGRFGADSNIRFTTRNVILAAEHIEVQDAVQATYRPPNTLRVAVAGVRRVPRTRGWLSVLAHVAPGRSVRFTATHLEVQDERRQRPSLRARQAAEAATAVHDLGGPGFLVGDFNSGLPANAHGSEQAFVTLLRSGLRDVDDGGPTCCLHRSPDLHSGGSVREFDHPSDHILVKETPSARFTVEQVWRTGMRKSSGYWHSDHLGIVSRVRLETD